MRFHIATMNRIIAPSFRIAKAWVLCLGLAYVVARAGYTIFRGAAESVEPAWRTLVFFLVAAILLCNPGAFVWKKSRIKTDNPYLPVVFVLAVSLGANMMSLWLVYAFGLYSKLTAAVILLVLTLSGLYSLSDLIRHPVRFIHAFYRKSQSIPFLDVMSVLLCLLFIEGIFEYVFGSSIPDGDALISWDKWANDIARRTGIGGYVVGAYPQGIPLINSLFYKLIDASKPICSVEHQYIRSFMTSYLMLLCFSVLSFGYRLNFPGIIPLTLFFGNAEVFSHAVPFLGYVDLPFVSMSLAMCAILLLIADTDSFKQRHGYAHVAASATVFGSLFSKGNGFAYLLPMMLFCWRQANSKCRGWLWKVVIPPLTVAGSFILHQCWFGLIAPHRSETSPFLHVLNVKVAHTSLFEPSFGHARMWLSQLSAWYGMADPLIGYTVLAVAIALTLLSLFDKTFRFFGLFAIYGAGVWFFTGSYDFRNAFLPLIFALIAVTGVCCRTSRRLHQRFIRPVGCMLLLFCTIHAAVARRLHHVARIPFQPPLAARELELSPQERRLKHLKWNLAGEMFLKAPYMLRANHIIQYGTESRFIGERGVFGGKVNAYNEGCPHDLAITIDNWNRIRTPPRQYVPITGFLRRGKLAAFHMLSPEVKDISSFIEINGRSLTTNAVFAVKQVHRLEPSPHRSPSWPEEQRDGFIAVTVSPFEADVRIALSEKDRLRDPFSAYFCSTNDAGTVRLLYWMEAKGFPFPAFEINSQDDAFRILNVSWGR